MPEVDINGGTMAGYLALPERGQLDHSDVRPKQVGANGVGAQILPR
jgi:hypothetical protein